MEPHWSHTDNMKKQWQKMRVKWGGKGLDNCKLYSGVLQCEVGTVQNHNRKHLLELQTNFPMFNSLLSQQSTYPTMKHDIAVPRKAYVTIAPKFLKK